MTTSLERRGLAREKPAAPTDRKLRRRAPTLRRERQLWRSNTGLLAAFDEVGRGALAGPVSVGVVLLAADTPPAPFGVADSKLLTPAARVALVPKIRRWALDTAVGHCSAAEIDRIGLTAALRTAAERAVCQLSKQPDWILLDGKHDYLSRPGEQAVVEDSEAVERAGWSCTVPVVTVIKGDLTCASIAAASVLAKTERDALLVELAAAHPAYGFEVHKAYATPEHLAAISRHGACEVHRRSWNLRERERSSDIVSRPPVAGLAVMSDDEQMTAARTAR